MLRVHIQIHITVIGLAFIHDVFQYSSIFHILSNIFTYLFLNHALVVWQTNQPCLFTNKLTDAFCICNRRDHNQDPMSNEWHELRATSNHIIFIYHYKNCTVLYPLRQWASIMYKLNRFIIQSDKWSRSSWWKIMQVLSY